MPAVNVSIHLPTLPDNAPWWTNYASWQDYWNSAELTISVNTATPSTLGVILQASTTIYSPQPIDNQDFVELVIEGNQYTIPLQANFDQLKLAFEQLNLDYQNLKTALKAAGIITNAT